MRKSATWGAALALLLMGSGARAEDCTVHTEQAEQTKCLQAVVENLRSEVDALTGAIDDLKASAADRERRIVEHMEKRIREETEPRVRAPF